MVTASNIAVDMHLVGAAAGAACLPLYRYTAAAERVDNITDWGLKQFHKAYGKDGRSSPIGGQTVAESGEGSETPGSASAPTGAYPPQGGRSSGKRTISKQDVFHYVYAVLHDPVYRETYAQNLKRDFPRIPFYPNFWAWAGWGERLMALHIGYEAVAPFAITRTDTPDEGARAAGVTPKPILKADRDNGQIRIDSETTLSGIPKVAFDYRLGNRSGLEWILEQYKEKTPKDPTIREKFNTYRFADHKDHVIDLIARVTTVSVETMEVIEAVKLAKRK
jgi:hypothetical protein